MFVERLEILLALLGSVGVLAVVASRLRVPVPIVMVLGGIGIAMLPGLPAVVIDPELVFVIFLPPLLYSSAFWFPWDAFRSNIGSILVLAVGLVLATMVCVAFAVHWLVPSMPLAVAFVLGAIVSPPDAVAATSVFRGMRVPQRLVSVLEGESLLNDSVGLVAYTFAVAAVVTGTFSLGAATVDFAWMSLGGAGLGVAVGWAAARVHQRLADPATGITLSILTPYAAYLLAEQAGVSGVLATVAAGLYVGHRAARVLSSGTRMQGAAIWEFLEYFLNGAVFILIGLEFPAIMRELEIIPLEHLFAIGAAVSVVVVGVRFASVFGLAAAAGRFAATGSLVRSRKGTGMLTVASWAGMRGAVSLAAALAVPMTVSGGDAFPNRPLILFLTYCVIFATLVVQGLTLPWVVRLCRIQEDVSPERRADEARLAMLGFCVQRIREENLRSDSPATPAIRKFLLEHFENRLQHVEAAAASPPSASPAIGADRRFLAHLMDGAREQVRRLAADGKLDAETRREIVRELDAEEFRLQQFLAR